MPRDVPHIRGKLGAAVRHGFPEQAVEFRADMVVALIENEIERQLKNAPPLTAERAAHLCEVIQSFSVTNDFDDVLTV